MEIYIIAGLIFFSIAGLGFVFVGESDDKGARRARDISGGKSASATKGKAGQGENLREKLIKMEQNAGKKNGGEDRSLKGRIEQAGLDIDPKLFVLGSAAVGLLVGGFAFLKFQSVVMALGGGIIFGGGIPFGVLKFMKARRNAKFLAEFPNAMDAIVRGVKSGLPLNECLTLIANEAAEPLRGEVMLLTESLAAGVPFETAVDRFAKRNPLQEVNFFRVVLVLQQRTGGSLAEVLGNLSKVLRERKLLREKVKALASEAKTSAWIIGSLPPIVGGFVSLTTPSYMLPLVTEPQGRLMLMVAAGWMGVGILAMVKMINFKM